MLYLWQQHALSILAESLVTAESFYASFQKIYRTELLGKDAFTVALWEKVSQRLQVSVSASDIAVLPKTKVADYEALNTILDGDIANLRRRASPSFPVLSPPSSSSSPSSSFSASSSHGNSSASFSTSPASSPARTHTHAPILLTPNSSAKKQQRSQKGGGGENDNDEE